jgi:hypothetical protein
MSLTRPQQSRLDDGFPKGFSVAVPPPSYFKPAGSVTGAWPIEAPAFAARGRSRGAKLAGLRYQKKVNARLKAEFNSHALIGPWFAFATPEGQRFCQLDACVKYDDNDFIIIETKIRHTSLSYYQLKELYLPVIRAYRPDARIRLVTIVGSYDCATPYPEEIDLIYDLAEASDDRIGVLKWK